VPLPLGLLVDLPLGAGSAFGFAELAAGSPDTEPRPDGFPCAWTLGTDNSSAAAHTIAIFMNMVLNAYRHEPGRGCQ
jgi:hypothetical protein